MWVGFCLPLFASVARVTCKFIFKMFYMMFSFDLRKKSKNFDTHDMHDTRVCANHYHTLPPSPPLALVYAFERKLLLTLIKATLRGVWATFGDAAASSQIEGGTGSMPRPHANAHLFDNHLLLTCLSATFLSDSDLGVSSTHTPTHPPTRTHTLAQVRRVSCVSWKAFSISMTTA